MTQVGGGTPSRQIGAYWGGPIPWASVKDFVEGGSEILTTQETITERGLRASASNLIPPATPLVCTRMAVGRSAMAPMPVAINQDVKALFPARGTTGEYLLRLLAYIQPTAEANAVGSTVKGIRVQDYLSISVPIGPASDQPRIVAILDTLDTAIRQTEAIIEKLKLVKQGLLHDLLTRGIDDNGELRPPQSEAPHLNKASALGWIPVDWSSGALAGWLDERPKNGYSPQESEGWTGSQMLGLGCLTTSGFFPCQLKNAPTGDARLRAAMLAPGDMLISRANTRELVGLVGTYEDVGTPCTYPDLMMRLTPSKSTSTPFMELVLASTSSRRQIQALASGTSGSMTKISGGIVLALQVAFPGMAEQTRILASRESMVQRLRAEASSLAGERAMKSGLADDLLTGRVRVTPLLTAT